MTTGAIMGGVVGGGVVGQLLFVGTGQLLAGSNWLIWNDTDKAVTLAASSAHIKTTWTGPDTGSSQGASCVVLKISPQESASGDFNIAQHSHTNGAGRTNQVMIAGYNTGYNDGYFKEDTAEHANYLQWESYYHPGSSLTEWHTIYVSPDGSFYARPFTWICDLSTDDITTTIAGNRVWVKCPDGGSGGTGTVMASFVTPAGTLQIYNGSTFVSSTDFEALEFLFYGNQASIRTQKGASSGSYRALLLSATGGTKNWAIDPSTNDLLDATGNSLNVGYPGNTIKSLYAGTSVNAPVVAIGSTPASAGGLRMTNDDVVSFRNYASNGDVYALTVSGSSDTVYLGASSGAKVMVNNASSGSIGFYGTSPVARQTGVAVTATGVHTALVNLGLITA